MGKFIRRMIMICGSLFSVGTVIASFWDILSKGAIDSSKISYESKIGLFVGFGFAIIFWGGGIIYTWCESRKVDKKYNEIEELKRKLKRIEEKRAYLVKKIGTTWVLAGNMYGVVQNYDAENPLQMMSISCNPICPECKQPLALSNGDYICVLESCILLNKKYATLIRDYEIKGRFDTNVREILVEFEREGG